MPILRKLLQAQRAASAADLNGTIEGRIGLVTGSGTILPCANAPVYLLVKPLDLEDVKQKAVRDGVFNPLLAHMFVEYVVGSPEIQNRLAYARTRTDTRGRFTFANLPGDRWYYVVAQALTGQALASWQVAVYLYPRERVQIFLHNANAALPVCAPSAGASG